MNHKRSCLFPSVYLKWPRMRCSNWYAIIESLWNVSKLIWGPMHKALMCRAYFHWHVVFSIKSSSVSPLVCVTSRQYYCAVHSMVLFTRSEQMDFCFPLQQMCFSLQRFISVRSDKLIVLDWTDEEGTGDGEYPVHTLVRNTDAVSLLGLLWKAKEKGARP